MTLYHAFGVQKPDNVLVVVITQAEEQGTDRGAGRIRSATSVAQHDGKIRTAFAAPDSSLSDARVFMPVTS